MGSPVRPSPPPGRTRRRATRRLGRAGRNGWPIGGPKVARVCFSRSTNTAPHSGNWLRSHADSDSVKAVEESAHFPPCTKHVERYVIRVPRKDAELSFSLRAADSPDAPGQPPFVAQPSPGGLIAADRQLEAGRTPTDPARQRTLGADPPRRVEEHDRVRPLEP